MTKQDSRNHRPQLHVVGAGGERQPFLRGMITHDLVQRGVPFTDAYALARALRDELAERGEITTVELGDVVDQRLEEAYGPDYARSGAAPPRLKVAYDGQSQPFSRGLLAQSLYGAGLDLDRAYRRVLDIQRALLEEGTASIDSRDLSRRVAEILDRTEGREIGGRYRLLRRLRELPRPLVVFLGGASGTGKSTLSLELAPLLRIYRINSTDTIRQVMRMAFSAAMLPALHRSSFEGAETHGDAGDRPAVTAAFEEQATRVCVGVRAVVDRAIAENTSVLVEGVHLLPPLVPFTDLSGAAYQLMLMVTTLDEEAHRSHLLSRAGLVGRRASRYLEHFRAIRHQQDLLLERAEEQEIPLLDTTERERTAPRAARLITDLLEHRLPWLAAPESAPVELPAKGLLLVIDGLPDRPLRALAWRTPLEAADTPTLDRLAAEGRVGIADPVAPNVVPDTASGNLALFGQPPLAMKRGPIEALGAGLDLPAGAVALRGNFATLDERGFVTDRRAGRIRMESAELAEAIDRLPIPGAPEVTARVHAGTEHRIAIVLEGGNLSSEIEGSDPGETAPPGPPLQPKARDPLDANAVRTATILASFEAEARKVLRRHPLNLRRMREGRPPANYVLTRGAGRVHALEPLAVGGASFKLACVSGDRTVLGIARALGGECLHDQSMTANLDTDLDAKFAAAAEALERSDLVVLHVKGADIAAHDRRPDDKLRFIEKLDRALGRFLEGRSDLRLAIASDHATHSDSGGHGPEPVPVLLWGPGIPRGSVTSFCERTAPAGELQRFPLQLLIERLFERFAPSAS